MNGVCPASSCLDTGIVEIPLRRGKMDIPRTVIVIERSPMVICNRLRNEVLYLSRFVEEIIRTLAKVGAHLVTK
jgi:hypothetical protein